MPCRIRNLRIKIVIDLIEHDVVDFYRLSATVERQSELVIIEINLVQEDTDNGAAIMGLIEVALFEHRQKVRKLLYRNDALFLRFNGQLSLRFGLFFRPLVDTLHDGINAMAFLKSLPKVFDGGIDFLNGGLNTFHGRNVKLALKYRYMYAVCDPYDPKVYYLDAEELADGMTYEVERELIKVYVNRLREHGVKIIGQYTSYGYTKVAGAPGIERRIDLNRLTGAVPLPWFTGRKYAENAAGPTHASYVVQSGDNLWKIAKNLLGDGKRWTEIAALNEIENTIIHTGEVLKIPEA